MKLAEMYKSEIIRVWYEYHNKSDDENGSH